MNNNGDKVYIGDGVYAANDGYGIILTTEDGISVTNRIYLEPSVYASLANYVVRLYKAQEERIERELDASGDE